MSRPFPSTSTSSQRAAALEANNLRVKAAHTHRSNPPNLSCFRNNNNNNDNNGSSSMKQTQEPNLSTSAKTEVFDEVLLSNVLAPPRSETCAHVRVLNAAAALGVPLEVEVHPMTVAVNVPRGQLCVVLSSFHTMNGHDVFSGVLGVSVLPVSFLTPAGKTEVVRFSLRSLATRRLCTSPLTASLNGALLHSSSAEAVANALLRNDNLPNNNSSAMEWRQLTSTVRPGPYCVFVTTVSELKRFLTKQATDAFDALNVATNTHSSPSSFGKIVNGVSFYSRPVTFDLSLKHFFVDHFLTAPSINNASLRNNNNNSSPSKVNLNAFSVEQRPNCLRVTWDPTVVALASMMELEIRTTPSEGLATLPPRTVALHRIGHCSLGFCEIPFLDPRLPAGVYKITLKAIVDLAVAKKHYQHLQLQQQQQQQPHLLSTPSLLAPSPLTRSPVTRSHTSIPSSFLHPTVTMSGASSPARPRLQGSSHSQQSAVSVTSGNPGTNTYSPVHNTHKNKSNNLSAAEEWLNLLSTNGEILFAPLMADLRHLSQHYQQMQTLNTAGATEDNMNTFSSFNTGTNPYNNNNNNNNNNTMNTNNNRLMPTTSFSSSMMTPAPNTYNNSNSNNINLNFHHPRSVMATQSNVSNVSNTTTNQGSVLPDERHAFINNYVRVNMTAELVPFDSVRRVESTAALTQERALKVVWHFEDNGCPVQQVVDALVQWDVQCAVCVSNKPLGLLCKTKVTLDRKAARSHVPSATFTLLGDKATYSGGLDVDLNNRLTLAPFQNKPRTQGVVYLMLNEVQRHVGVDLSAAQPLDLEFAVGIGANHVLRMPSQQFHQQSSVSSVNNNNNSVNGTNLLNNWSYKVVAIPSISETVLDPLSMLEDSLPPPMRPVSTFAPEPASPTVVHQQTQYSSSSSSSMERQPVIVNRTEPVVVAPPIAVIAPPPVINEKEKEKEKEKEVKFNFPYMRSRDSEKLSVGDLSSSSSEDDYDDEEEFNVNKSDSNEDVDEEEQKLLEERMQKFSHATNLIRKSLLRRQSTINNNNPADDQNDDDSAESEKNANALKTYLEEDDDVVHINKDRLPPLPMKADVAVHDLKANEINVIGDVDHADNEDDEQPIAPLAQPRVSALSAMFKRQSDVSQARPSAILRTTSLAKENDDEEVIPELDIVDVMPTERYTSMTFNTEFMPINSINDSLQLQQSQQHTTHTTTHTVTTTHTTVTTHTLVQEQEREQLTQSVQIEEIPDEESPIVVHEVVAEGVEIAANVEQVIEEPVEQVIEEPVEEVTVVEDVATVEEIIEEPVEEVIVVEEKVVEEPVEEVTVVEEKVVEEPVEEVIVVEEKVVEEPVEEVTVVEEIIEEPVEEVTVVEEIVEEPVEEVATVEEPVEEVPIVEEIIEKPVEEEVIEEHMAEIVEAVEAVEEVAEETHVIADQSVEVIEEPVQAIEEATVEVVEPVAVVEEPVAVEEISSHVDEVVLPIEEPQVVVDEVTSMVVEEVAEEKEEEKIESIQILPVGYEMFHGLERTDLGVHKAIPLEDGPVSASSLPSLGCFSGPYLVQQYGGDASVEKRAPRVRIFDDEGDVVFDSTDLVAANDNVHELNELQKLLAAKGSEATPYTTLVPLNWLFPSTRYVMEVNDDHLLALTVRPIGARQKIEDVCFRPVVTEGVSEGVPDQIQNGHQPQSKGTRPTVQSLLEHRIETITQTDRFKVTHDADIVVEQFAPARHRTRVAWSLKTDADNFKASEVMFVEWRAPATRMRSDIVVLARTHDSSGRVWAALPDRETQGMLTFALKGLDGDFKLEAWRISPNGDLRRIYTGPQTLRIQRDHLGESYESLAAADSSNKTDGANTKTHSHTDHNNSNSNTSRNTNTNNQTNSEVDSNPMPEDAKKRRKSFIHFNLIDKSADDSDDSENSQH